MRVTDLKGDTNFTLQISVGREGSKAWAMSFVPYFSLPPPHLAFLTWGDFQVRPRFACFTIPSEKMKDYSTAWKLKFRGRFWTFYI